MSISNSRGVLRRFAWAPLLFLGVTPLPARAQEPAAEPFRPPIGGAWEPVQSLGQPPRWKPFLTGGYGVDNTPASGPRAGGTFSIGVYHDITSPVVGLLGISGEAYGGQRGDELDTGLRLNLESRAFFLHGGLDWNHRTNAIDWAIGLTVPPRRGGLFGRGGQIRFRLAPSRDYSWELAATLPLRQPAAGRTRTRAVDVEMPPPPSGAQPRREPTHERSRVAVARVADAMGNVNAISTFFWLIEDERIGYRASIEEWRETLVSFRSELDVLDHGSADNLHEAVVVRYHTALEHALGLAAGAHESDATLVGRRFGDQARRIALEEVVLPYNRTIGQYKQPDRLDGLIARARARWVAWLETDEGHRHDPAWNVELNAVFDAWMWRFELLRRSTAELTNDSRMHWLPLALVLRPEEHRTHDQIDALVRTSLGRGFEPGNAVLSLNAVQFQHELERSLHDTRAYHVLWIHDYRGENDSGRVDRAAFHLTTAGYLRALLNAVRSYDDTGVLPVYMIVLDQHYYELNNGRLWMTLLEQPLTHEVELADPTMRTTVTALQDSLRIAVAASNRLQAEVRAFGADWVGSVVKVHVNITNPSDFSFRSRRIFGPPVGADNLSRDHRKIVIRDVFEDDPASGEVLLAGVGAGEHYASPTWEDRTLLMQGPGAAETLVALRRTLDRNLLGGERLPAVLRPRRPAADHARRVAELASQGATADVLQVHNRTGWGVKDATFVNMLLYDLVPPGTVIYVPDSLWTSYQWMALLVDAALRGCHVYVVGPAIDNAPSDGFPQMSVIQELFTRLVVVQDVFGDRIREGGGDLRIGLYSQEIPLDDRIGMVNAARRALDEHEFLRTTFPLPSSTWQRLLEAIEANGASLAEAPVPVPGSVITGDDERLPQLHRKTQWLVDREVLRGIAADPRVPDVLVGTGRVGWGMVHAPESGAVIEQQRTQNFGPLRALALEAAAGRDPLAYYASGSMNKNVRSMALDGEVTAVVAGEWALQPYLDFVLLSGGVTWVDDVAGIEALLPPYSELQRRIGRWLFRIL